MVKASDVTSSLASANVYATSQHVDANNTTTAFPVEPVEDQFAGYIFMCNAQTKQDCFIYRVFGLPASRMRVAEKIKPNTKLFLFDFDVKLLYGLYVADSSGKLAQEPHAFGGRFPAQVKFSIARDCLPLPEVAFKGVIEENYYRKSKFKQELNDMQVNKLVSLFRPIFVPASPPLSPRPSPAFLDAVRNIYEKYVQPSQQVTRYSHMHHERSVPEVPEAVYANSYYGQNSMPQSTMSPVPPAVPSCSMLPLSLRASQLIVMAAEAQNTEDQASSIRLPLNAPGFSHAHMSYNDVRGAHCDGYQDQIYSGSHPALSVTTDQAAQDRPIHAYEMQPLSVSSFYTQNQGGLALPHTLTTGSSGVRVDNAHLYHTAANYPAAISSGYSHTQGQPGPTISGYTHTQGQPGFLSSGHTHTQGQPGFISSGYTHTRGEPGFISSDYTHTQGLPGSINSGYTHTQEGQQGFINSGYTHTQGQPGFVSSGYTHTQGQPGFVSSGYTHTQGHPALHQTQPSISSGAGAHNPYLYDNGTNSASLAYDYGTQGYYSCHQNAAPTIVRQVNNAPVDASEMHPAYGTSAPPVYMPQ